MILEKKKKILVTGATGFVGRKLVADLLNRNYLVNCAVRTAIVETDKAECKNFVPGDFNHTTD